MTGASTELNEQALSTIHECLALCDLGFATCDPKHYDQIANLLQSMAGTERVDQAIRLCGAGNTLSSPRFAYPHIATALRPLVGLPE